MRMHRLDSFRVAAILAVICIHTRPFLALEDAASLPCKALGVLIKQGSLFAVSFFLVIAGYFFGRKLAQNNDAVALGIKYSGRLLIVLFFWDLVYLLAPALSPEGVEQGMLHAVYAKALRVAGDPVTLIFQGTKTHLWFLVSLLLAVWTLVLLIRLRAQRNGIVVLAVLLYGFGLLGGPYSATPVGIDLHFNTRNFIFLSMLCVVIGWVLSQNEVPYRRRTAVLLAGCGFGMQLTESFFLWKFWQVSPTGHDYLLGTVFFASGVALLALRKTEADQSTTLSRIGRLTLGVYTAHILFRDLLDPLGGYVSPLLWQVLFPVLVYAISLAAVIALSRTRLRPVVL